MSFIDIYTVVATLIYRFSDVAYIAYTHGVAVRSVSEYKTDESVVS